MKSKMIKALKIAGMIIVGSAATAIVVYIIGYIYMALTGNLPNEESYKSGYDHGYEAGYEKGFEDGYEEYEWEIKNGYN